MSQDIPDRCLRWSRTWGKAPGMVSARLLITAVTLEKRRVQDVADTYGVSRSWIYELLARYRDEGEEAFTPRSRRPHSSPNTTPNAVIDTIHELRTQLTAAGLDAGAETIAWHLQQHGALPLPSRATIHRILAHTGQITPQPRKKPRSAWIRFEAAQPNEMWQSDVTHYPLAEGTDTEIITWLDDHSRYALHISAHPTPGRPPRPTLSFRLARPPSPIWADSRQAHGSHSPHSGTVTLRFLHGFARSGAAKRRQTLERANPCSRTRRRLDEHAGQAAGRLRGMLRSCSDLHAQGEAEP